MTNQRTFLLLITLIGLTLANCDVKPSESNIENTVRDYIKTYQERKNYKKFLSFYSDEIVFEDILNGNRAIGKDNFKLNFDWENPHLVLLTSKPYEVEDLIIQNNQATITGYFNPFKWHDQNIEAMYFTTILTFDEDQKIVKHVNWVNYPPSLLNLISKGNANLWINQN
ncbi:nuclear transport factor 2 family protein [Sediminitomix flava]|uniref:SnoaL-like protein n=1 Tax=Sediminitomix flava TaxID=379075 RepID=A0A315ZAD2_SEDFL|nr:nuclear transport factor 2 family protein [Sediminitomix flava]PWJ42546.1 hypothetical protein BC781_10289 [Sediminitomix flava]